MSKFPFVLLSSFLLSVGLVDVASAQGTMLWLEGGREHNVFGDGSKQTSTLVSFGVAATIAGDSKKHTGFALVVPAEVRVGFPIWSSDALTGLDIALRAGPVAFGPGATFGMLTRGDIDDPRCLVGPIPDTSSCDPLTSHFKGKRDIGGFLTLGVSGFAKVNFGPEGRAFLQVRYFRYEPSLTAFRSSLELTNDFNIFANAATNLPTVDLGPVHPADFPAFTGGHDVRVSAGFLFGGAGKKVKVLRLQFVDKAFTFTHVLANNNGIFDQNSKQLTLGFGWVL